MQPIRFLVLGIGLILSACGPNRPPLTICFYSVESHSARCTDPKGKDFEVPEPELNKWLALSEADTQKLLDYVLALERKAAACR